MANPVSHLYHRTLKRLQREYARPSYQAVVTEMRAEARSERDLLRVDYISKLKTARSAFKENVLCLFYETLALERSRDRIEGMIGHKLQGFGDSGPPTPLVKSPYLTEEDFAFFRSKYDDLIEFCQTAFPDEDLSRLWGRPTK